MPAFQGKFSLFDNQTILITGGTGSFGNAFIQTVLDLVSPKRLIVYSRDELKQYEMQQKFANHPNSKVLRFFIGDVRDVQRLRMAFRDVDYVIHAAALKQVPAAEYNPTECIHTNIIGAENVVRAAIECDVGKVVALSTDKAANPVNLYGATKLASDKVFVAANNLSGTGGTRFSIVRYGNVTGSRGSVIPLFKRLNTEGVSQLPVTDPEMTRFWITLPQAVDFVCRAANDMIGGEIFVPKIPSMKILDLVKAINPKAGYQVIGIRPGEKLHEMMISKDDARMTVELDDYYIIKPSFVYWSDGDQPSFAGSPVKNDFQYSSDLNTQWMDIDEIKEVIEECPVK